MKKTIIKVVTVLGVLVMVAIVWTFTLGPNGVVKEGGMALAERVEEIFSGIGLDVDLTGMYEDAFEGSGGTGTDDDIIY